MKARRRVSRKAAGKLCPGAGDVDLDYEVAARVTCTISFRSSAHGLHYLAHVNQDPLYLVSMESQ